MTVLIVDPALHSLGGHHYNAVQRLQAEGRRLGIEAACLASAFADARVTGELGALPVFTRSVYGRSYAADEFSESVALADRELSRALRRPGGLPDLLVLPCCDAVLAAALTRHIRRAWWRSPPSVIAWILYAPHHLKKLDDPTTTAQQEECRNALAGLAASVGPDRWQAFCETPALAEYYRALAGIPVGVLPGPGLAGSDAAPRGQPGRRLTVSCIGFANRAKGYGLLPDAVGAVLQRRSDVGFAIHGIVEGSDAEEDRDVFERLSALGDAVRVHQGVLSADEYGAWLDRSDLLLLPYDPAVYGARGSGVFTDARRRGLPVVAPRACSFARPAFDGGWGVAMEEYSAGGLASAILTALDRHIALALQARAEAAQVADRLGDILAGAVDGARTSRAGLMDRIRRLAARLA
ncbi:glycosyltransferase [Reyranella sp.]|uniref:glycosyltransferase n=1 Tax=Reyranella sp. TaxID=1929291 RepID=UPI003BAD2926